MTLVMKLIGREDEIVAFLDSLFHKGYDIEYVERQHWNVDRCAFYADVQEMGE